MIGKRHEKTSWGDGSVPHLDRALSYLGERTDQNSSNGSLYICTSYCIFYLIKEL